jgi:prephenate dehydrogenase
MDVSFGKVCIIGVGLIGGSLAGIIKTKGLAGEVVGVGRGRENLETARTTGLVDSFTHDARKGVAGADLVVLCCPVGKFEEVARGIKPYLADNAIVTDVGSVKGGLVGNLDDIFHLKARFVGAHPIAGSERAGSAAADMKLFEGAKLIVTPTSRTDPEALEAVVALWEETGASIVRMDPDEHDRVFALVSHLPHVAAYAMVSAVAGMDGGSKAIGFAAGGFRDFTRIAASPADVWRDICLLNGPKILGALDRYQEELWKLRELIEKGDGEGLEREFDRARSIRMRLG